MTPLLCDSGPVTSIATIDFKFLGMATPVSRLKPINWVLQER